MTGRRDRGDALLAVVGVAAGLLVGITSAHDVRLGVGLAGAGALLVLVLHRPATLPLLALLGVFGAQRLGSGGGISLSDVLTAPAAVLGLALLARGPELSRLRGTLVSLAIYLACLLPTVALDDSTRGWFEWAHRLSIVGGALVVGAALTREGLVQRSLRALVVVACALGLLAVVWSLHHGLAPAQPLGYNKNFLGAQLGVVLVLTVTAARQVGLSRSSRVVSTALLAAGLLATQSRGGMIAAAAGILLAVAFEPRAQGRQARGLILLVTLVLAATAFFSIRDQLRLDQTDLNNSSIGVRRQVERRSHEIWATSPVIGVGLKYFNSGEYGYLAQPPNVVIDNELAESGIVGLAGFVVLQAGAIGAGLRRRRGDHFAVVGAACVAVALVHGMVDIYWIGGSITLPFILLGMSLATDPADRAASGGAVSRATRAEPLPAIATRP